MPRFKGGLLLQDGAVFWGGVGYSVFFSLMLARAYNIYWGWAARALYWAIILSLANARRLMVA